jgi:hypothetical protein
MRVLVVLALLAPLTAMAGQLEPSCTSTAVCQQMALDAADRQDYEAFHTLAWRAIQTGPRDDARLMALLARAQSLSGRPHDALVMLRRLAQRGVAVSEAETSDDFRRVRALAGWPAVHEAMQAALNAPAAAHVAGSPTAAATSGRPDAPPAGRDAAAERPAPAPGRSSTAAPAPAAASALPPAASAASAGLAIPQALGRPVALAYDNVSRRFVLADDSSDTLKIVDELAGNLVDLVSRRWSGIYRTTALAIDHGRGDLWVVGAEDSAADTVAQSAVHRLQLVSGRLLYTVPLPADAGSARFSDVALTRNAVLILDGDRGRLFALAHGARSLQLQVVLDGIAGAARLAAAGDTVAYVAHAGGIARVDLAARRHAPLTSSADVSLVNLEWLGWHNGALLGVQRQPDGSYAVVRIVLDRRGTTATTVQVVDVAAARTASIAQGMLHYLGFAPDGTGIVLRRLALDGQR